LKTDTLRRQASRQAGRQKQQAKDGGMAIK